MEFPKWSLRLHHLDFRNQWTSSLSPSTAPPRVKLSFPTGYMDNLLSGMYSIAYVRPSKIHQGGPFALETSHSFIFRDDGELLILGDDRLAHAVMPAGDLLTDKREPGT
jgi:hypothetical protein